VKVDSTLHDSIYFFRKIVCKSPRIQALDHSLLDRGVVSCATYCQVVIIVTDCHCQTNAKFAIHLVVGASCREGFMSHMVMFKNLPSPVPFVSVSTIGKQQRQWREHPKSAQSVRMPTPMLPVHS